jgi:iron(III) transport system substrate-binding protein
MKNLLFSLLTIFSINSLAAELVMYTDRPATTTTLISTAFKAKTGHDLNIIEMKTPDLINRLNAEGATTNGADVIFVKDLVYLNEINSGQFFQAYSSANASQVSPLMKSKNWVGITYRARTVVYNTIAVDPATLKNYADLATPEWAGRVCVRSSNSSYNEALIANFIADFGAQKTTDIINGWVQNFAAEPYADDTAVIKAVADGTCDVGVVNTYYLGRLFSTDPQLPVGIVFVDQAGQGTHTNGSGIGISSASTKQDLANQLIDFMLSPDVQKSIVAATFEFPANTTVTHPNAKVGSWMGFKINSTPWENLTPFLDQSSAIMKSVNYN